MKAITTSNLTKHFRDVRAVDGVTISLDEHRIHGLLGRNGAGKTTLMQLLTGQIFATSGEMSVLGASPVENAQVLRQTCFIQEGQRYPDAFRPIDVLSLARSVYPGWDQTYADELAAELRLPLTRQIRKLSRGQRSALGIVLGLASRAPVTFFDEPYMGLDVVARHTFYERLLADFSAHPRTVVLSTHHIDEVANLLEHVILIDDGKVMLEADIDELETMALEVSGRADDVATFIAGREVLSQQRMGGVMTATLLTRDGDLAAAQSLGLTPGQVSLQNLIVGLSVQSGNPAAVAQTQ